jgi:tRNA pseudouridine38-40 synthase
MGQARRYKLKDPTTKPANRPLAPGHVSHFLIVAYDGTPFSGWQRQPGKRTVQEELEKAVKSVWGEPIDVHSSGRTDTGVHALGQSVTFEAAPRLKPAILLRALNAKLPFSIRVVKARLLPEQMHARFDATGKTYEYVIYNHPIADPFRLHCEYYLPRPLDVKAMQQAARHFVGTHDFASFTSNPGYERETTVREIREARFLQRKDGRLVFRITADGFLYRMVRNLMGALVKVGQGKLTPDDVKRILEACSRQSAPNTAPAHGLYLKRVYYAKRGL